MFKNYLQDVVNQYSEMNFIIPDAAEELAYFPFVTKNGDKKSKSKVPLGDNYGLDVNILLCYCDELFDDKPTRRFACKIKLSWSKVLWIQVGALGILLTEEFTSTSITPKSTFINASKVARERIATDANGLEKMRDYNDN